VRRNKRCDCGNDYYSKDLEFDADGNLVYFWRCTNCGDVTPVVTRAPARDESGLTAGQRRVRDRIQAHLADKAHWSLVADGEHWMLRSERWYEETLFLRVGTRGAVRARRYESGSTKHLSSRLSTLLEVYVR
jgi:hypothetical protein